jgi:dUTP pyrophosphatase
MSQPLPISILRLPHGADLPLPTAQSTGAAGLDLMAAIGADEQITIKNCERALVPTGIALQLPQGYEAQVRPRSGLAMKHGVTVLNAPGTVDADYRGEIKVLLVNHGQEPFVVTHGLRIAQLVIAPVVQVQLVAVSALETSARGDGGFGSTGLI